jgi:hypothetical protein
MLAPPWRTGLRANGRVRRAERDVRAGGDPVSTRLAADRVEAEVIALAAPEQDVRVALELALGRRDESELAQSRLLHQTARRQVARPDTDVVDDLAHRARTVAASPSRARGLCSPPWASR